MTHKPLIDPRAPHLRCIRPQRLRPPVTLPPAARPRFIPAQLPPLAAGLVLAVLVALVAVSCANTSRRANLERSYNHFAANPINEFEGLRPDPPRRR